MQPRRKEAWANGESYELFVGRWSRLVAREFVSWLAAPTGGLWLDVACGTGALSQAILDLAAPRRVDAIDRSTAYATFARERLPRVRWNAATADAQSLPLATSAYDTVVSGLALNFFPEPPRAAAEMARVARRGGAVAIYVWDYAGGMEFMRHFWDAAIALDPEAARDLDEGRRFAICQPQPLTHLFESAGLHEVQVRPIEITTAFRNFDDFWKPFFGGQGPAAAYLMSLSAERQDLLRDRIRERLPLAADGSISLLARAWAVRGTR